MRILLTNDDGIEAPGINNMRTALEAIGEVYVVAPKDEKSACGHGITMTRPLRVEEVKYDCPHSHGWSVDGTPADCVKLAITTILKEKKPDICISGINRGANLGTDVLYSGTVSAAIEGALMGIPSIAVSLASFDPYNYSTAASFINRLTNIYLQKELPPDTLLNVNVPDIKSDDVKGIQITKLGERNYENIYDHRHDPRGRPYYWLAGDVDEENPEEGTDVWAVKENYISVTPIHFDLTNHYLIDKVRNWKL